MLQVFDLLITWLSMFFDWFVSLELFRIGLMPVYLYEVIIFGAVILPFFFTLLKGGLSE